MNSATYCMSGTPTKPDEYFMPGPDDGSWHHQSELDQQEQTDGNV